MLSNLLKIGMPVLLLLQVVFPAFAVNDKNTENKEKKPEAPMVIEGDKLSFSDKNGDVSAQGNVSIVQNQEKILTDEVRGNTKKSEFWIDGKFDFSQPGATLSGVGSYYNYNTHMGTMKSAGGKVESQYVSGKSIDVSPTEYIIHDGTITKCPAKVPDYHISASKIEVWPDDKLIAYNAKFWIKDMVIYTMPKYLISLKKDAKSVFPRIGYNSSDGFSIHQYFNYPLNDKFSVYADPGYFSKYGFKMNAGIIEQEANYTLSLVQGDYEDSNNNWIKKEPEFKLDFGTKRIGKSPLSYNLWASYGKWKHDSIVSWHQDYNLYFSRDAIALAPSVKLYLGTGVELIRESYNSTDNNILKYDATLTKDWSSKLNGWLGYHYTGNNQTLFAYDQNELARELDIGFSYKIDKMNAVVVQQSYDMANNRIKDLDYTWKRNLHCWELDIQYRAKRGQINMTASALHF
ncbi:MAG: LPS-assembly protein LptD [Pelosinus sp.]|nr:LPS-assembly protein LptD [Pelosinus sp.]